MHEGLAARVAHVNTGPLIKNSLKLLIHRAQRCSDVERGVSESVDPPRVTLITPNPTHQTVPFSLDDSEGNAPSFSRAALNLGLATALAEIHAVATGCQELIARYVIPECIDI